MIDRLLPVYDKRVHITNGYGNITWQKNLFFISLGDHLGLLASHHLSRLFSLLSQQICRHLTMSLPCVEYPTTKLRRRYDALWDFVGHFLNLGWHCVEVAPIYITTKLSEVWEGENITFF